MGNHIGCAYDNRSIKQGNKPYYINSIEKKVKRIKNGRIYKYYA